jgi:hypothetical protein
MFGSKETEEKVFDSKFIKPGVHEVTIAEVTGDTPEGKSPYVMFKFVDKEGKAADIRFYLSTGAVKRSLEKIVHLGTKLVTREQIDATDADTATEYGANLNKLLRGKKVRIKFSGEQVQGTNGKPNWFKAVIGLPAFAEEIEVSPSKLKFDENSKWDMKRLEATSSTEELATANTSGASDDLPF